LDKLAERVIALEEAHRGLYRRVEDNEKKATTGDDERKALLVRIDKLEEHIDSVEYNLNTTRAKVDDGKRRRQDLGERIEKAEFEHDVLRGRVDERTTMFGKIHRKLEELEQRERGLAPVFSGVYDRLNALENEPDGNELEARIETLEGSVNSDLHGTGRSLDMQRERIEALEKQREAGVRIDGRLDALEKLISNHAESAHASAVDQGTLSIGQASQGRRIDTLEHRWDKLGSEVTALRVAVRDTATVQGMLGKRIGALETNLAKHTAGPHLEYANDTNFDLPHAAEGIPGVTEKFAEGTSGTHDEFCRIGEELTTAHDILDSLVIDIARIKQRVWEVMARVTSEDGS